VIIPESLVLEKPIFVHGMDEFNHHMGSVIQIPRAAIVNDIYGKMVMTFVVDEVGNIQNINFGNNLKNDLDNMMKTAILTTSGNWLPSDKTHTFILPVILKRTVNNSFTDEVTESEFINGTMLENIIIIIDI